MIVHTVYAHRYLLAVRWLRAKVKRKANGVAGEAVSYGRSREAVFRTSKTAKVLVETGRRPRGSCPGRPLPSRPRADPRLAPRAREQGLGSQRRLPPCPKPVLGVPTARPVPSGLQEAWSPQWLSRALCCLQELAGPGTSHGQRSAGPGVQKMRGAVNAAGAAHRLSPRSASGAGSTPSPSLLRAFPGSPLSVRVLLTLSPPRAEGSVGIVSDRASLVGLVPAAHCPGAAWPGSVPRGHSTRRVCLVLASASPAPGLCTHPSSGLHPASSGRPPPPGPTVAAACAPGPPLAPCPPGPRQAPRSLPALPGRALSLLASASTRRRWRPCAPACRLRARWRGCPGRWRPRPQCLARAVPCDMRETNENERSANTHNAYASQIIKRLRTTF